MSPNMARDSTRAAASKSGTRASIVRPPLVFDRGWPWVIVTLSRETELQVGFVEDLFASSEVSADFTIFVNVITLRL